MAEHPWAREAGETAKAFDAFELFRRLGPDRTVQGAWEQYWNRPGNRRKAGEKQAGLAHGYFRAWSSRHCWHQRALAWDEEVAALARDRELDRELKAKVAEQEEERRQRQLRREEARAARTVGRQILRRVLKAIEERELEGVALSAILPHLQKVGTLIELGQRLERQEVGQSAPEAPQTQLSDEQARALAIIVRDYVPAEKWHEAVAELERALIAMRPEG
jgi:hypothetical protein